MFPRLAWKQGSGEALKVSLASFTKTSNTLNRTIEANQSDLTATMSNFKELSIKLNQTAAELKPLMSKFNTMADSLNNLELATTLNKINTLLDEATTVTAAFSNKEGSLGKLLYEDSLYNNLNKTLYDLDSLLININNNPKHFFGPLGKSSKKIEKDRAKQQEQQ